MRNIILEKFGLFIVTLSFVAAVPLVSLGAKASFSVPHLSDAAISEKSEERVVMTTGLSHTEVVAFYKDFFQNLPDIKTIDRKDYVQILDHGNLPWHSINIDREARSGQLAVTVVRDNWVWILGTLVLRFIGVFVVLVMLFIGMSISGKILPLFSKSAKDHKDDFADSSDVVTDNDQELVAVAIAAATHFKNRQQGAV